MDSNRLGNCFLEENGFLFYRIVNSTEKFYKMNESIKEQEATALRGQWAVLKTKFSELTIQCKDADKASRAWITARGVNVKFRETMYVLYEAGLLGNFDDLIEVALSIDKYNTGK